MKKIRMIKSVYDNPQAETIADYYNETSRQLTAFFFGDGHQFFIPLITLLVQMA